MPVRVINFIPVTKQMIRGEMAEALNRAATEHRTDSRLNMGKRTRRLWRSTRVSKRATPRKPEAIVQSGGIVVDGELVDYGALHNYGHRTRNGGFVPGTFYWESGIEAGKRALMEEAQTQVQARARRPRGRAGVQHADTPEQLAEFFLNEGVE